VCLHIDGIANARRIAQKAEVDMEMVRACLRVLKHHGVIALVDMFFYSNRYEPTARAAALLAGHESALLHEAVTFSLRRSSHMVGTSIEVSPPFQSLSPMMMDHSRHSSAFPVGLGTSPLPTSLMLTNIIPPDRLAASLATSHPSAADLPREDWHMLRRGVAEFYSLCHRHASIGDVWMRLLQEPPHHSLSRVAWRTLFHRLDHRRLITFGVVHGLVQRMHRFPMHLSKSTTATSTTSEEPHDGWTLERSYSDDRSSWTKQHRPTSNGPSRDDIRRLWHTLEPYMDGQHCDDELACLGERSLDDLLELVFPEERIVSIYASMSS
jgi:hypothetical protein